jgi:catechol 2,3-dioxygenase-like lactoylglutathione lyase family enzyme
VHFVRLLLEHRAGRRVDADSRSADDTAEEYGGEEIAEAAAVEGVAVAHPADRIRVAGRPRRDFAMQVDRLRLEARGADDGQRAMRRSAIHPHHCIRSRNLRSAGAATLRHHGRAGGIAVDMNPLHRTVMHGRAAREGNDTTHQQQFAHHVCDSTGMSKFEGVTPILRVENLTASVDYYVHVLGFAIDFQQPGVIASVGRDRCHLFLVEGDLGHAGGWVWIGVDDIEPLYETYKQNGAIVRHPPTNYAWAYEMQIGDPDGNVLRFGSDPKENQPRGEWLDMHGIAWEPIAEGGWRRVLS